MEDIRLESALSKLFWLLLEEVETDDAESSAKSVLVLCKAEIDMNRIPFHSNFSQQKLTNRSGCEIYMWTAILSANMTRGRTNKTRQAHLRTGQRSLPGLELRDASETLNLKQVFLRRAKKAGRLPIGSSPLGCLSLF
jgi:hypothetical protein